MFKIVITIIFLVALPGELLAKIIKEKKYTYNGSVDRSGQPHGQGTITYIDGKVFVGTFSKGAVSGYGILTYIDGSYTEGNWKDGKLDGPGKKLLTNGARYSGTFKASKLIGDAIYTFVNGDVYEGPLENTELSGVGTLKKVDGDKYTGLYKDDKLIGDVIYTFVNGDVYEGPLEDTEPSGWGILKKADGDIYTGLLVKGKPDGLGTYEDFQNHSTFNGFFKAGRKDGAGSMVFPDGRVFKGFWVNDMYIDERVSSREPKISVSERTVGEAASRRDSVENGDPSCPEYSFDLLVLADSGARTLDFDLTSGTSSCKR
jgi:hypothetical protein